MSSMSSGIKDVNFEVSYQRLTPLAKPSDDDVIRVKFDGDKREITAVALAYFYPLKQERLLTIRTRLKTEDPLSGQEAREISVSAEIAPSLSLRVRENIDTYFKKHSVPLSEKPVFEQGKSYRIQVIAGEGEYFGKVVEKPSASSGKTAKDESLKEASEAFRQRLGQMTADDRSDYRERVGHMGEALIQEGLQNLLLALQGGAPTFNSSSSSADVFAHGIQGVVRAGQHMHPDIEVPHARSSAIPSDLDKMSVEELQKLFDETFTKDKEFESQRIQAAMRGDIRTMNGIMYKESVNSQLLINLSEALERKGVKTQIPQSDAFQFATEQSAEAHAEVLEGLGDACKMQ